MSACVRFSDVHEVFLYHDPAYGTVLFGAKTLKNLCKVDIFGGSAKFASLPLLWLPVILRRPFGGASAVVRGCPRGVRGHPFSYQGTSWVYSVVLSGAGVRVEPQG